MYGGKNGLKRRLHMIARLPQSRRRFDWTGPALSLVLVGALLTSGKSQTHDSASPPPATQPGPAAPPRRAKRSEPAPAPATAPHAASRPDRPWRDAASADRNVAGGAARWAPVAGLGPTGRAVALEPAGLSSAWGVGDRAAPALKFDFTAPATECASRTGRFWSKDTWMS